MSADTDGRTTRLELADQDLREWEATVLDARRHPVNVQPLKSAHSPRSVHFEPWTVFP